MPAGPGATGPSSLLLDPGPEGKSRGGKEARCQGPMNEQGVWMRICHAQGASLASQSVRGDGTLRRKRASSLDWPGSASSHASCRLAGKGSRGNQTLARWDEGSDLGPGLCYSLRSKTIEASRCLARRLDLLDEGPAIVFLVSVVPRDARRPGTDAVLRVGAARVADRCAMQGLRRMPPLHGRRLVNVACGVALFSVQCNGTFDRRLPRATEKERKLPLSSAWRRLSHGAATVSVQPSPSKAVAVS